VVVVRLEEDDVMATGRSSFAKRQRDMAKKAKASAKREKKLENSEEDLDDVDDAVADDGPQLSNETIMDKVADLHRRYDDGQMDLDTFDEERANLMAQISID
jgi:hypothetical protein